MSETESTSEKRWATSWSVRKRHLVGREIPHAYRGPMARARCSSMTAVYLEGYGMMIPAADSDRVMALPACVACTKLDKASA